MKNVMIWAWLRENLRFIEHLVSENKICSSIVSAAEQAGLSPS